MNNSLCFPVYYKETSHFSPSFFKGREERKKKLSHWDRLPLELRQTIQWMADRQQAHDRLKRGWEKKYNVKASKTFANFVKFDCNQETTQTSRALIYPSNIINNVMFVSIVWYITTMNRPSQTINVRGTKHIFRNGLRISVLDEELSQAQ